MSEVLRSNLEFWQKLQDDDYFENHPLYGSIKELGGEETIAIIQKFCPVNPSTKMVIIGCGYGRETLKVAPLVNHVHGIDVNQRILDKAVRFLVERGIHNFTPVLAREYKTLIPDNIDLVYSIVVMQHLTRDLVRDYFSTLGQKLAPGGHVVVQFIEELSVGVEQADAELKPYEPAVSWTSRQLAELSKESNLRYGEVQSLLVTPTILWHWVHFLKT